ncbi:MAG TPA: hypothetical protein VJ577_09720 [Burkholderiaceae bacterium]|nr:hypothetical protein [Burkholderiaceae bacterium]
MENKLIPSFVIFALTLVFCPIASASKSNSEVCKSLKSGAYLTDEKFNQVNGKINLGTISASWGDLDYSGIKYYIVAPKEYSDGAMPALIGFSVELREAAFSCRGFAIFEARFGLNAHNFGPGSFSFRYPLMLLNKESLPVNVRAPERVVGNLKTGWLNLLLNEKQVSGFELGAAAAGSVKVKFINSGNSILATEKWTATDEQNDILLIKNHCANIELKPGAACEAEFKWNSGKGGKSSYASWAVDTKNPDRTLEVIVEERNGALLLGIRN